MSAPGKRNGPGKDHDAAVADLARGANGLGEFGEAAQAATPVHGLVRAGFSGATALGLAGAALTLGLMALVWSLGQPFGLRGHDDGTADRDEGPPAEAPGGEQETTARKAPLRKDA